MCTVERWVVSVHVGVCLITGMRYSPHFEVCLGEVSCLCEGYWVGHMTCPWSLQSREQMQLFTWPADLYCTIRSDVSLVTRHLVLSMVILATRVMKWRYIAQKYVCVCVCVHTCMRACVCVCECMHACNEPSHSYEHAYVYAYLLWRSFKILYRWSPFNTKMSLCSLRWWCQLVTENYSVNGVALGVCILGHLMDKV